MREVIKKVIGFCERYGVYLALLAFIALFVAGLRVLDESDGGLLQLRNARSDFEDYYNASRRMAEHGDLYNMEAMRNMENSGDPGIDVNNPLELLQFSMTPEGRAYLESLKGAGSYLYLPFFAFLLFLLCVLALFPKLSLLSFPALHFLRRSELLSLEGIH